MKNLVLALAVVAFAVIGGAAAISVIGSTPVVAGCTGCG
jgi:hypothetical protein